MGGRLDLLEGAARCCLQGQGARFSAAEIETGETGAKVRDRITGEQAVILREGHPAFGARQKISCDSAGWQGAIEDETGPGLQRMELHPDMRERLRGPGGMLLRVLDLHRAGDPLPVGNRGIAGHQVVAKCRLQSGEHRDKISFTAER